MKKLSYLLIVVFIFMCFPLNALGATAFDVGDGTIGNPYIITTVEQLAAIKDDMSAHYKLGANIDVELTEPIGGKATADVATFAGTAFTGSLDGDGKYVTINLSGTYRGALIPVAGAGATIKNLTVKGTAKSNYLASGFVGEIVAANGTVTISKCKNEATVQSWFEESGGIIGAIVSGEVIISDCVNNGDIKIGQGNTYSAQGGIIGKIDSVATGSIEKCVNNGEISEWNTASNKPPHGVGGIIGYNEASGFSTISCKNYGSVSAGQKQGVGGIVGFSNGLVTKCANFGTVSGGNKTGGITGHSGASLNKSYNAGNVIGNTTGASVGGITGITRSQYSTNALHYCYNLGSISAKDDTITVSAGAIAGGSYNASNGLNLQYCYDASLQDIPMYNTAASANNLSNNLKLSLNPESETPLTSVTYVDLETLKTNFAVLGTNFEAAVPTKAEPFNLPQLVDNKFDGKSAIYIVSSDCGANGSFDIANKVYVKYGEKLNVTVTPESGYLIKDLSFNDSSVLTECITAYEYVTPEIYADSTLSATFETYRANPEISDAPGAFTTKEDVEVDGTVYKGVKLVVFSKVFDAYAHKLTEYGMLFAKDNETELTVENGIKANALKKSDAGSYGILFYGNGLEANTDYYTRAYAIFEKQGETEPVIIYGDVKTVRTAE